MLTRSRTCPDIRRAEASWIAVQVFDSVCVGGKREENEGESDLSHPVVTFQTVVVRV